MDQVSIIAFQGHVLQFWRCVQQPDCCAVPASSNGMQHVAWDLDFIRIAAPMSVCTPGTRTCVYTAQCLAGWLLTLVLLLCRTLYVQAWKLQCW